MSQAKEQILDRARAQVPPSGPQKPAETFEVSGDEATLTKTTVRRVKSLEDLIEVCSIDTKVWYVERWVCNKWEMGSVPRATRASEADKWIRPSTKASTVELFQVKAWLIRADVKRLQGPEGKAEFLKQFRAIVREDRFHFPRRPVQKIDPVHKGDAEIAVVCSSDLHLSETVRPDDANGINVYNTLIAANRLWEHAQKVKSILARHMSLYTIEQIWMPLLGDVISGTVHEEFVPTNDLSDPAAVVLGARLYAMFVTEIAGLGIPVLIDAVHGNHARTTPKMPTKRQARTNMDWQIYEHLSDLLRALPGVEMNITTSQIGQRKLYGWNYLFEHGVCVTNGKEEDFEDRLRALFDDAIYREATGSMGSSFDQVVIGNLHKPKFLERTVVNGSYIGQNELGQSWRLKPIRAQQLMWGVGKKFPRTWQYQLDLTHIKHESTDNPFGEYAAWFLKKHGK
jgi:hypothetical protein